MTSKSNTQRLGIAFHVLVADRQAKTVVERAPDDGMGSPDTANRETLTALPPAKTLVIDERPSTGETWFYRALHIKANYDDSDPTPWVGKVAAQLPHEYPPAPTGTDVLAVDEDTEETDQTGTLDLTVFDPQNGNLTVKFWTRQGKGSSWGTVDERTAVADGTTETKQVSLVEKHQSYIQYEVIGSNGNSTGKHVVDFDRDHTPEINVTDFNYKNGNAVVEIQGDADTASIWRKPLGDPDGNAVKVISSRSGTDQISLTSSSQVFEYAGKNSAGRFGPWITVEVRPGGGVPGVLPEVLVNVSNPSRNTTRYTFWAGEKPNSSGSYEIRWRSRFLFDQDGSGFGGIDPSDLPGTDETGWNDWQSVGTTKSSGVTVDVSRGIFPKEFQVEIRDSGLGALTGTRETFHVRKLDIPTDFPRDSGGETREHDACDGTGGEVPGDGRIKDPIYSDDGLSKLVDTKEHHVTGSLLRSKNDAPIQDITQNLDGAGRIGPSQPPRGRSSSLGTSLDKGEAADDDLAAMESKGFISRTNQEVEAIKDKTNDRVITGEEAGRAKDGLDHGGGLKQGENSLTRLTDVHGENIERSRSNSTPVADVVAKLKDGGDAPPSMLLGDVIDHPLDRHTEEGTAQDGDFISFSTPFESVATVTFIPQRARSFVVQESDKDQRIHL